MNEWIVEKLAALLSQPPLLYLNNTVIPTLGIIILAYDLLLLFISQHALWYRFVKLVLLIYL